MPGRHWLAWSAKSDHADTAFVAECPRAMALKATCQPINTTTNNVVKCCWCILDDGSFLTRGGLLAIPAGFIYQDRRVFHGKGHLKPQKPGRKATTNQRQP